MKKNVASGSGVGSNINISLEDGKVESKFDVHDKKVRDGPSEESLLEKRNLI